MIKLENIQFAYKKNMLVLKAIDLEVKPSDIIGILGHNGAGKTTLFRIMLGLMKPNTGVVDVRANKREIGYVPEDAGIYLGLSAMQNMLFRLDINHAKNKCSEEDIKNLIQRVKLSDRLMDKSVECWSNGMKKRLALICSLITK